MSENIKTEKSNIKKNKNIGIFIIFFVIALLISAELICFIVTSVELNNYKKQLDVVSDKEDLTKWKPGYKILQDFPVDSFRPYSVKNNGKKPVLWFGCSFAEGNFIPDGRTPYDKLSDLTGRTCINRAQCGSGLQYIYNQLQTFDFKKIAPDVDYIVYVYIDDHLHRLYAYQHNPLSNVFNIRYVYKNKKLQKVPSCIKYLYSFYLVQRLANIKTKYQWRKEYIDHRLFNITIREITTKLKELYPSSKFILIEFSTKDQIKTTDFLPDWEVKQLEEYGIDVVKLRDYTGDIDITDDKYWFEDKVHPREELWDILLPELVKKYNM